MNASNALELLRPLTQEERMQAMQNAKDSLRRSFGDAPKYEQYAMQYASKHPAGVRRTVTVLCIIVLSAAFALSAMRLYYIGSETFGASIPDAHSMVIAGIATVLLAEAAQLVSTLALAMFGETRSARYILYATASGATCIALVGNAQVALPGHASNAFAYLDAFVPPLLVIGIGHILKYQWLHSIEQKHEINQKYDHALEQWQGRVNADALKHEDWMTFYANALRDELRRVNARIPAARAALPKLDIADWRALIQREIGADQWFVPSTPQVVVSTPPAPARQRRMLAHAPTKQLPHRTKSVTGQSTDEIVTAIDAAVHDEQGVHVRCPYCNRQFDNPTSKGAGLALTAHLRRCDQRGIPIGQVPTTLTTDSITSE